MVLSNKKLKQKLRAEIAESLTSSATRPDDYASANPDLDSQSQSLKQLLDSVTQKPKLSKREKNRRRGPVSNSKRVSGDDDDEKKTSVEEEEERKDNDVVGGENSEKKKRKREEGESGELGEGEGDGVKEAKKANTNKKNKKKKQKKQKKKKKKNEEEDNKGSGGGEDGNQELNKESDSQVNNDYLAATKVYVGGIPYSSTEIDIKRYFESCGTIDEIDCMTFPDSGRFRGIAIITFRTEGAAKRALALDGSEMDGLLLRIQPYKATNKVNKTSDFAPKIVEGYNRIYVGNLSWDITEEDLRKLFSDCKIESVRFGMDKETGEFKGYAHVNFSDSLSLTLALKLDQEIVCGRPVKISCAVPRKAGKTQSSTVPTQSISVPTSNVVSSTDMDNANASSAAVSGKIRRRTCYECGQKGHLSSACPKKAADPTNSNSS